jgi:hypothetical protein
VNLFNKFLPIFSVKPLIFNNLEVAGRREEMGIAARGAAIPKVGHNTEAYAG